MGTTGKLGNYKSLLEASVKSKFKGASLRTLKAGSRTGFGMEVARQGDFRLVIVKAETADTGSKITLTTETNSVLNKKVEEIYGHANRLGFNVKMSAADKQRLAVEKMQAEVESFKLKAALKTALMGWLVDDGAGCEYLGEILAAGNKFLSGLDSTKELMTRLNDREALAAWFVEHPPK